MLETLKLRATKNKNFLKERWESPIHSQYATDQQGRLWPSSEEFFHPLNPIYSCFLKRHSDLEYFKVILLRDGAYMLLDFFFKFPTLKASYAQILVPANLSFLVPKSWHSHVVCYKVRKDVSAAMTKKLVFLAVGSECSMSWPIFKPKLLDWLEQFPKDAEVSLFFSTRADPLDPDFSEKKLTFEFLTQFSRYFDSQVTHLTGVELRSKFSKPDNSFINMDLYQSGTSLCSMEVLASSSACPIYQRPEYDGFTGKLMGSWPISFNTHFDLYSLESRDHDFEELLYTKKMIPATGAALAYPLVPKLLALMEKRLNIF
jgi:hypothetical protein